MDLKEAAYNMMKSCEDKVLESFMELYEAAVEYGKPKVVKDGREASKDEIMEMIGESVKKSLAENGFEKTADKLWKTVMEDDIMSILPSGLADEVIKE